MFKGVLKLRKLSTRDLCILAMLIAITAVLSVVSGFLRTPVGKLNVSFVSVYVGAALFGPVAGGVIGAFADLLSVWFSSSGAPIILFTVIEFINGFLFGILFYRSPQSGRRGRMLIAVLAAVCVVLQFVVNLLRVPVLAELQNLTLMQTFITRIPTTTLMLFVKFVSIIVIEPYMDNFRNMVLKVRK